LTCRKSRANLCGRLPRLRGTVWRFFSRAWPWLVGLVILAYLLWPYRLAERRAQLAGTFAAAPAWTAAVALAGALAAYAADCFATYCVFVWAHVRMRFREVAVIRGVTYFFALVNYNLGQAALIVVLARKGIRARRATGIILFIMGINFVVLVALASASVAHVKPQLRVVVWLVAGFLPLYLAVIALRPRALRSVETLAPLFDLGVRGHALAFVTRIPHVMAMMLAHFAVMRCFGVAVPFAAAALYIPIIFVVAVLPISVQGLGTMQAVAIELLAPYAPSPDAVLAYSLYTQVIWMVSQVIIGTLCVRTDFGRSIRAAAKNQ
jgi:Lysylphosphatidylglycerol synthase TM region